MIGTSSISSLTDAPFDSKQYVRKDGTWEEVAITSVIDWQPSLNIKENDIVNYLDVLWRCHTQHTAGSSFDLSKFTCITNGVEIYEQASHGFSVLDVVRYSNGWVKAKADNSNTLSDPPAIVWMVSGDFYVVVNVPIKLYINNHGLNTGIYFLSSSTNGGLSDISPIYNNPIINVIDSNNIQLLPYRPVIDSNSNNAAALMLGTNILTSENNINTNINWEIRNHYKSVTSDLTLTFSNNANGMEVVIVLVGDSSTRSITFPSGIKWNVANYNTLSANTTSVYRFIQINSIIYGSLESNYT